MQLPQRYSEFSSKLLNGTPQDEQRGGDIFKAMTFRQHSSQIPQSCSRDTGTAQLKHVSGYTRFKSPSNTFRAMEAGTSRVVGKYGFGATCGQPNRRCYC